MVLTKSRTIIIPILTFGSILQKMLKFNLLIIVLLNIALATSCQQKEGGSKQAKLFLTQFDEISKEVDKYGAPYDRYNQILTKQFTNNDRAPLKGEQIDSLAK